MTAEDHLRALLGRGCDDGSYGADCFYCGHQPPSRPPHHDACPFIAAEKYLKHQDAARAALKQLADDFQDFKPFI